MRVSGAGECCARLLLFRERSSRSSHSTTAAAALRSSPAAVVGVEANGTSSKPKGHHDDRRETYLPHGDKLPITPSDD
jgi:hypothetical protein